MMANAKSEIFVESLLSFVCSISLKTIHSKFFLTELGFKRLIFEELVFMKLSNDDILDELKMRLSKEKSIKKKVLLKKIIENVSQL
jgi:hypothetical protein